ncbi:succinylglutamate desuccinylase/aspartoacylase family protein [Candidatus Poriferisodalis sp.]|uniref:succinylglutamate desuccinylase/aspartoacylase family protein n=1 Tax=Candidatus Poriferisodalis sp. TaxID=3101277 RepID=UPI003B02B9BB
MIDHTQRRVAAGTAGGFDVWTASADEEGPCVVVLGGIHGDETQGVLAAGRLAIDETRLTRGSVAIVPICHEAAFEADSRTSAIDDGNLARVFPGDVSGGPTSQIAHHLFAEVLSGADLLIDLHTSGQEYDMPFLAGYQSDSVTADSLAKQAASAFGAEFLWRHPGRTEGRSVSVVDQAIYVECPGGGPVSAASVDAYVAGVRRVLAMMDMVAEAPPDPATAPIGVTGGGDLDRDMISVRHEGQFLTDLAGGAQVEAGQLLGTVVATGGQVLEEIRAPGDAWVMAVKRRPPVARGDLVVCLATADD